MLPDLVVGSKRGRRMVREVITQSISLSPACTQEKSYRPSPQR